VKRIVTLLGTICFLSVIASAQYGTAPNNYYPDSYTGSIFQGVVAETGDDQIILTFTKGSSTETFTGLFETGGSVPTAKQGGPLMMPTDIPKGTAMTAFFNARTKKVDGKKIKENVIVGIAFDTWQGQKIAGQKESLLAHQQSPPSGSSLSVIPALSLNADAWHRRIQLVQNRRSTQNRANELKSPAFADHSCGNRQDSAWRQRRQGLPSPMSSRG